MAADNPQTRDRRTGPSGESPRDASTFTVDLEKLGYIGPKIPRVVAADVEQAPQRVTVRTPRRKYEFSSQRRTVRAGPVDGALKVDRDPDDLPSWLRVTLRTVGKEGLFR